MVRCFKHKDEYNEKCSTCNLTDHDKERVKEFLAFQKVYSKLMKKPKLSK